VRQTVQPNTKVNAYEGGRAKRFQTTVWPQTQRAMVLSRHQKVRNYTVDENAGARSISLWIWAIVQIDLRLVYDKHSP